MPDFEKLMVILTIENAQMLRINPELLEMNQNQENDLEGTNNNKSLNQVDLSFAICYLLKSFKIRIVLD